MAKRRRYKNPPIEEAVCEFRFTPGPEWDLTIPGKLHAVVRDTYPGKPRHQNVVEAALQSESGRSPNLMFREGIMKVQLVNEAGNRMLAVGQDVLSVHVLRPYQNPEDPETSGWDEFRPRIETGLRAYWTVAEPVGVHRIGIRYINKIVIPRPTIRIETYFACGPPPIKDLPEQVGALLSHVEYRYEDGAKLLLTHANTEAPIGSVGFLLDLDVVREAPEPLPQERVMERVDELRERERSAFEAVITNAARELFDA
jgi:uncharacterized protein (TIGR04255 family)